MRSVNLSACSISSMDSLRQVLASSSKPNCSIAIMQPVLVDAVSSLRRPC